MGTSLQLERFRYHIAEDPEHDSPIDATEVMRGFNTGTLSTSYESRSTSYESRARFFLNVMIEGNGDTPLKFALDNTVFPVRKSYRIGNTTLVRFGQCFHTVPVFGAEALVELDDKYRLISIRCVLGAVDLNVSVQPGLSLSDATQRLAHGVGKDLDINELEPPTLELFQDHDRKWRLVWHFVDVPAFPTTSETPIGEPARPERGGFPSSDFLVDAHNGDIIISYGKIMSVEPAQLTGLCEEKIPREFRGIRDTQGYKFHDIDRGLRTHDSRLRVPAGELRHPLVSSSTADVKGEHKAAVSAHFNATLVCDFYRRRGFSDGIPPDLISVINCQNPDDTTTQEWRNAIWFKKKVWYGQVYTDSGELVSVARFLDLVTHEITHGIVSETSQLHYKDDAGALDESFADIFGVIVKNMQGSSTPRDVATWDWKIGCGFVLEGGCMRDLGDPQSLGHPHHANFRLRLPLYDYEREAHANSCIHSKAVYTAISSGRHAVPDFDVEDWIAILAKTMMSLTEEAEFSDVPTLLKEHAFTRMNDRLGTVRRVWSVIDDAYRSVGIAV